MADTTEQDMIAEVFALLLSGPTHDGGVKRARNAKPAWWHEQTHEAALFSHLSRWKHGETADADSGSHPLVHLAWRALAIAYQETYGCHDPDDLNSPYMLAQLIAPSEAP